MSVILDHLAKNRDRGVPIVGIDTTDANAFIHQATPLFEGPVLMWDRVRGLRAVPDNAPGKAYLRKVSVQPVGKCQQCGERMPTHLPGCDLAMIQPFNLSMTTDLVTTLDLFASEDHKALPPGGVIFVQGAHRYMDDPSVVQGLLNVRDFFKLPQHRTVIVLLGPGFRVGNDLSNDVMTYVEDLPNADEARELVLTQFDNAGLPHPDEALTRLIVDAVIGLAAFSIEQVVALSLDKDLPGGINLASCWDRKAAIIEATDGLRLYRGPENFTNVVAQDAFQSDFNDFMANEDDESSVAVFVWIDEGEKLFAGSRGDLSGVSQDHEAVFLSRLQESKANGAILYGAAGAGKSTGVKSLGGQFRRPVIIYDPGAMQASLVGESQRKVRAAHRVIEAISGGKGKAFWLMTANDLSGMKPEVKERFLFGTYFVDLPTREEKDRIWAVKIAEYGLDANQPRPNDEGWVGRNIDACCRKAKMTKRPLVYVAETIVGYGVSNASVVERMRSEADGVMLSVSKRGVYRRDGSETQAPGTITVKTTGGSKRQIKFN